MKKLLLLPILFFTLAVSAQTQTEDEVYIGKGKTFGNYNGTTARPINGQIKPMTGPGTITGKVVGICMRDCCNKKLTSCSIDVERDDSTVTIGTRDFGFTVPKAIVGHMILIEGKGAGTISGGRKRRDMNKDPQQDIQFAATGIKIID
ncbi:MAG: DUF4920 domain-containing protein [Chitinophagaceae bacterium]